MKLFIVIPYLIILFFSYKIKQYVGRFFLRLSLTIKGGETVLSAWEFGMHFFFQFFSEGYFIG